MEQERGNGDGGCFSFSALKPMKYGTYIGQGGAGEWIPPLSRMHFHIKRLHRFLWSFFCMEIFISNGF